MQNVTCFRNGKSCKVGRNGRLLAAVAKSFRPIREFLAATETKHNANKVTSVRVRRNGNAD